MTSGTAVRPRWDELPAPLRAGLTRRLGPIINVQIQTGGFTPGLAARLRLADDARVFVKGIPADHPLADKYRTEAHVTAALPVTAPAPRLKWADQIAGWVVLALDDVDGRHVDLAPESADIPRVIDTVASLAAALTPAPFDAPTASRDLDFVHGWRELAATPPADLDDWARDHLDQLADLETGWLAHADGDTLVHGDINSHNTLATPCRIYLVDWAQPVRGAAWLDVVDLIPHLILAGHAPAAAEQLVLRSINPDVEAETLTSYAVAFAGYWTRMSRYPAPSHVPNLRPYQARASVGATAWAQHRLGTTT
ncbi:phosphotransferase family protein [Spirillospora sp. CA-294931]|uniref:phosphotransferase family protein n=1 Tax=Spirillospora sp. CA-294931 TaxID=3240042 RepID=UPI003D8B5797